MRKMKSPAFIAQEAGKLKRCYFCQPEMFPVKGV